MKTKQILVAPWKLPFEVPMYIVRVEMLAKNYFGWQVRYPGADSFTSRDNGRSRLDIQMALDEAVAYLNNVYKGPIARLRRVKPRVVWKLKTGKRPAYYEAYAEITSPLMPPRVFRVYIGTANTFTIERKRTAIRAAQERRKAAELKYYQQHA